MTRHYSLNTRHAATQAIMRWYATDHLPDSSNKQIVQDCEDLALTILAKVPDDPELVAGLRHLLEAKDAFVRANVAARMGDSPS